MENEALIPYVGVITEIRQETPDVKTFRVVSKEGEKLFEHIPGQCAMLSIPGVRGPYGNGFPVDTDFKGKDLVFIAGGIGLAPLHSVINYCRDNAKNYGTLQVIYGARSKQDLVDFKEIIEEWENDPKVEVCLTIDNPQDDWDGHVGFIPNYVKELNPDLSKTILMCGPPIMIKFTLGALKELGFSETQVYTTMELRMKCGVGKCGRCNIGNKYVCKDGPVFRFDQLDELPNEY